MAKETNYIIYFLHESEYIIWGDISKACVSIFTSQRQVQIQYNHESETSSPHYTTSVINLFIVLWIFFKIVKQLYFKS